VADFVWRAIFLFPGKEVVFPPLGDEIRHAFSKAYQDVVGRLRHI